MGAFYAAGALVEQWLGVRGDSPFAPLHRVALGQLVLVLLFYLRSILAHLGLPGVTRLEIYAGLAVIAYALWRRTRQKSPAPLDPEARVSPRSLVVLMAAGVWIAWWISTHRFLAYRTGALQTPSSDPDVHAFLAKLVMMGGKLAYTQAPYSTDPQTYPSAFAALNALWGMISGAPIVKVLNCQLTLQACLAVGLVIEAAAALRRELGLVHLAGADRHRPLGVLLPGQYRVVRAGWHRTLRPQRPLALAPHLRDSPGRPEPRPRCAPGTAAHVGRGRRRRGAGLGAGHQPVARAGRAAGDPGGRHRGVDDHPQTSAQRAHATQMAAGVGSRRDPRACLAGRQRRPGGGHGAWIEVRARRRGQWKRRQHARSRGAGSGARGAGRPDPRAPIGHHRRLSARVREQQQMPVPDQTHPPGVAGTTLRRCADLPGGRPGARDPRAAAGRSATAAGFTAHGRAGGVGGGRAHRCCCPSSLVSSSSC